MRRIIIADEQAVTRHAVRLLLEKEGFEVLLESGDGLDTLRAAHELHPDLIVAGLGLARLGGLEVVRRLHQREPDLKTLVLASQDSEHFVGLCIEAGASGFVSKRGDLGELTLAVRSLLQNRTFFPARAPAAGPANAGDLAEADRLRSLSAREMSVLYYLASGYTNRAIADELLLSDRTVSTYKLRLFRKLKLDNMMELAELAWRNNILGPGHVAGGEPPKPWKTDAQGRELLRTILDAIPTGISINDVESRLLFANQFLLGRFERRLDDVIGKRLSELNVLSADEAVTLEDVFIDAVRQATSFSREVVLTYKGESLAGLVWGAPIRNRQGLTVAMICGVQNMAEQEQAFLSLREAKERAQSASRARSRLLVEAVEALRRELAGLEVASTVTATVTTTLANGNGADTAAQAIAAIEARLDNIQALIEADAANAGIAPVRCDIAQITGEALRAAARTHPQALFTFDAPAGGPLDVWIDKQRYQLLVRGLLARASDAVHHAPLDIALRTRAQSRALVEIELEMRDTPRAGSGDAATRRPPPQAPALLVDAALAASLGAELIASGADDTLSVLLRLTVAKAAPSGAPS